MMKIREITSIEQLKHVKEVVEANIERMTHDGSEYVKITYKQHYPGRLMHKIMVAFVRLFTLDKNNWARKKWESLGHSQAIRIIESSKDLVVQVKDKLGIKGDDAGESSEVKGGNPPMKEPPPPPSSEKKDDSPPAGRPPEPPKEV